METHCYNIDSKFRNTTSYPNSADFVFNRVDEFIHDYLRFTFGIRNSYPF